MMKYFKTSFIFLLFSCIITACGEDQLVDETYSIKYGSECGWCAGQEYIILNNEKVQYIRNIPCGENKGTTNKSRVMSVNEWNSLYTSFDYSLFLTLNYNECNVCADGCDEIIEITKNDSIHELRYSFSDKVEGVENLRSKLSKIMEEMRDK